MPRCKETVTGVARGIGASGFAKQHSDELRPKRKALGGAFGAVLLYQGGELGTRKIVKQLIEQAGSFYDCLGPRCGQHSAKVPARNHSSQFPRPSKPVLDKSDSTFANRLLTQFAREQASPPPGA